MCVGMMIIAYKILVGEPEGKRTILHRWECDIRLDLRERLGEDLGWIYLDQDRDQMRAFVKTLMNLRRP